MDFKVHKVFAEGSATYIRDLTQGFRRGEHDVDVWVGQEGFDIVEEPKQVAFGLDVAFAFGVQQVIYEQPVVSSVP